MSIKTNPIFYIAPLAIVLMTAVGAGIEDPFIALLNNQLNQYNRALVFERTHLITDRFVYKPGDKLWFKGYVTNSGQQINSEDFFIRLLNSQGEEMMSYRYPLMHAEVAGQIVIPKSCIPGKYWLVAYTGWMKNTCPQEAFRKEILISKYFEKRFYVDAFFDKMHYNSFDTLNANIRILDASGKPVTETVFDYNIGNLKKTDIKGSGKTDIKGKARIHCVLTESNDITMLTIEIRSRKLTGDYSVFIPTISSKPTITFHPEGYNIAPGIKNVVVMKAVNSDGLPEIVNGVIKDSNGKILQHLTTNEHGYAKFDFLPRQDTCYFAWTSRNGTQYNWILPETGGFNASIRYSGTNADSAVFAIATSDTLKQKTYWIGVINGRIVYQQYYEFTLSGRISIPLLQLPSGIMQVSVFNDLHQLVAERLIQVNIPPRIHVKPDRQVYQPRQRVSILMEHAGFLGLDDVAIAVSLRNQAFDKYGSSLYGNLNDLCTDDPLAHEITDEELLTTAYRIINWEDVLQEQKVLPEYNRFNGLTGKVIDKKENIVPLAKVRVTHFPGLRLYETQSDENGVFHIRFGSDIIDYKYLNILAYDARGKTSLAAQVDNSYLRETEMMLENLISKNREQKINDLIKYGEPDLVYALRFGPGKFRKSHNEGRKKYDPFRYTNYTDIMDIIQDIQPYALSNNRIYFLNKEGMRDSSAMAEAILVINGKLKGNNVEALKGILPSDITNINISGSLTDVHKYTPLNFSHVIEITTIQSMYKYRQQSLQIGPGIFTSGKPFYSPDYSVRGSSAADNRRTLYWNPSVKLNEGSSTLITFYTSDVKGTFIGHITGLDKTGNPVEAYFEFTVE